MKKKEAFTVRILVTGGAGFIGSCLSKKLLSRRYEVKSYDLKVSGVCDSITGDIRNQQTLYKHFKLSDSVFHLAAIANLDFARLHPQTVVDININGTYLVAKTCADLGIPLNFASTACVYGNIANYPSDETSVCVPTDIYGATKATGEHIIKALHEKTGLDYNILRFGTTYGPRMRKTLAVHIFINQALNNEALTIHGNGLQTRCMIYIDDLVEACSRILDEKVRNETLNLATEEELSVLQMKDIILEELGKPLSRFRFVEDRPGQIMKERIDISKAKKLLNWTPKTSFREGVRKTIGWIKGRNDFK